MDDSVQARALGAEERKSLNSSMTALVHSRPMISLGACPFGAHSLAPNERTGLER